MLFLNFSSVFAVLMMVEGLSATVNSFQCPDPVKAQAMCSRTDGDTTVVEKPYPDGLGYYCSSNIKDASQNCCNLDLKIGDSPNEFLVPKLRCGGAHVIPVPRS
ncbi:hypothetical protein MJO29_016690 [Puccinia striiformis f. sp. tritici]|nr:hypothetical protein MJO29_016690 [Puccinia striiformis f. sp. tritici]